MHKKIEEYLGKYKKVICFCHSDLDGILSCVPIKALIGDRVTHIELCSYNNIDFKLKNLTLDRDTFLFLTDIFPKDPSVLIPFVKTKQIIVIDHHESTGIYADESNMFFIQPSHEKEGMSAALLVYTLLETEKIKHLKELMEIVSDYDLWIHKNPRSKRLNILFQMYWQRMADAFIDGRTKFNDIEEKFISTEEKRFEDTFNGLEFFDIDTNKKSFRPVFFTTIDFVNECADRLLNENTYNFCFIYSTKSNTLSIRHRTNIHAGNILTEMGLGGGHKMAAGIRTDNFSPEWLKETIEKVIQKVEDELD